jgi:DNA-binding transcriptional ArsR family regulator
MTNGRSAPTKNAEAVEGRLVRALGHPLRARALASFNERTCSPKEVAAELDVPVSKLSYHVKVLRECQCIELVSTVPRRGATEHFYKGTTRSFFNDSNWEQLSTDAKNGISITGLKMIVDTARAAVEADTFDSRGDRHLSRTPLVVDEQGWGDLTEILAETLERVMDVQTESALRLAKSEQEGIRATVAILGFESPVGS